MKKRILTDGMKMLWKTMVILACADTANIYLSLSLGTVLGDFTEHILVYDVSGALRLTGSLLLCILSGTLVLPMVGLLGNYFLFMDALRHDRFIFDKYFRMPYEVQRKVSLGEVEYRVENDPNQFRLTLVFMVRYILCTVAALPAIFVVLAKTDPLMLLIVVCLSVIKWLVAGRMGKLSAEGIRAEREFNTQLRKYEMDICSYPALFSTFKWEDGACGKIHEYVIESFRKLLLKTFWGRAVFEAVGSVTAALYPLLILLAGCVETGRGKISLADILAILVIFPTMEKVIDMIDYCVRNRKNMADILERMSFFYCSEGENLQAVIGGPIVKKITARSLSYKYDNSLVLENLSMEIFYQKTAICGENGCGKSTLVKILCGFLQDYQGEIRIGEERLKGREEEWFRNFGYVPQEPFLFDESLEENIAMSEDYNLEKMEQVIALTGLKTLAGRKLSNTSVSGGERQRLALARALYCERDWIFMDEPTNNLDADTVRWLNDFIMETDKALVFVTHDKKLMEKAENIIAL